MRWLDGITDSMDVRCAGKAGNPFQTTQGNRLSCRDQEGRRGSEDNLPPAAAAAKSLQSCPTLCDPIDGSPPGSPFPGILQARALAPSDLFLIALCSLVSSQTEDCLAESCQGGPIP